VKKPQPSNSWPNSWRTSYEFDLSEVFGEARDPGYAYAYGERQWRTIAAVTSVAHPGDRILDLGAAQGNFSILLAERGYHVTWNDLRAELAGYVALKHDAGRLDYAPGNIFELDLRRGFDVVVMTEVIEHVAHPDQLLQAVASLVRPSGHVVMTTPNGSYLRNRLPRFSASADPSIYESGQFKADADGHIFLLHPDEIEPLAAGAGLILRRLEVFTNPLTRGALGTGRILRFVPRGIVTAIERRTAGRPGAALERVNMHLLAVFERLASRSAQVGTHSEVTSPLTR
jgi:2-polyprenyl-3-methyl-5-hydroxy-6-metoxy-1,4-benzoquinol methylase